MILTYILLDFQGGPGPIFISIVNIFSMYALWNNNTTKISWIFKIYENRISLESNFGHP